MFFRKGKRAGEGGGKARRERWSKTEAAAGGWELLQRVDQCSMFCRAGPWATAALACPLTPCADLG